MLKAITTVVRRRKAAASLNRLSDRSLLDIGLNPAKVRQGAKGYPWK